jgi:hypothetical protein
MEKEKSIIVKLPPKDKSALERQARANGRAMMREAASLIKDGLKKGGAK